MTGAFFNGRRIADYLERPVASRVSLRSAINLVRDQLPDTVIFGGMIRDFALGRARTFTSDVDLVSHASSDEIRAVIEVFKPNRNKFGGFRFRTGKWRFDIWPLSETWAFKEGIVMGAQFEDLLATTFFNVDAALYHLGNRTLRASNLFESGMKSRILDINLERNPSPDGMAKRAVRMAMEQDFAMSAKLVSYVIHELQRRPLWLGEVLWDQMLHHAATTEEPFHMDVQPSLPIAAHGYDR